MKGQLPPLPDAAKGQANPIGSNDPTQFRADTGSVNPSNIFNFGGDWTPNSRTVVAVRYGYFYYNSEDRGLPAGNRYIYQLDLTPSDGSGADDPGTPSPVTGQFLLPVGAPPTDLAFAHQPGFANISANLT